MFLARWVLLGLMVVVLAATGQAAPPPPRGKLDPAAALGALTGGNTPDALAGNLRGLLLAHFPDPLFEDARQWNLQKLGPRGKLRNHGRWRRVRVSGRGVRDTLIVDLRDLQQPGGGRTTFSLYVSFDAVAELERQNWKMGVRVHSGSTRARFRVRLTLHCEATTRLEKGKDFLPDAVFRLRVVRSDLRYDNVVVEHTAGVGGEAAKVLGDAVIDGLRQWKPSLEQNLVAKANAAIVKAADTKEIRVNLLDLFSGQKKGSAPVAP
jgi:hypothetical protein